MVCKPKNVVVLGSTGSIGKNTLEVIAASSGALRATVLSAHTHLDLLVEQAIEISPDYVIATCDQTAAAQNWDRLPSSCKLLVGRKNTAEVVCRDDN